MRSAEQQYRGQTVLVTGASSGLGAAFARALAGAGADLVLVARRKERLEELTSELARSHRGRRFTAVPFDLAIDRAGELLRAELDARDLAVTAVINNAGIGMWGRFADADPEALRRMTRLNIDAVMDVSRSFLDAVLEADAGFLLNVTSVAAYSSIPMQGVYSATKAFVLSFTESLWAETRGGRARILAFAPGVTATEFFDVVGTRDADGGSSYQSPEQVVAAALAVLERRDPPPSAVSGRRNAMLTLLPRLLTRRLAVTLTGRSTMGGRRGGASPHEAVA